MHALALRLEIDCFVVAQVLAVGIQQQRRAVFVQQGLAVYLHRPNAVVWPNAVRQRDFLAVE